MNQHINTFFSLLSAGLWERPVKVSSESGAPGSALTKRELKALFALSEQQSVTGLVTAGLERVEGATLDKAAVMAFMTSVIPLEARNAGMDDFIAKLVRQLREEGIEVVLVKGQGIARCYERPSWRMSGDVDFLLDAENYEKAKAFLKPRASSVDEEDEQAMHLGMHLGTWIVELHGHLHANITKRTDGVIERLERETTLQGATRVWKNGDADILLPSPDNDVIFVFTHILQHFFRGGIGLRQICDWCRLLWTYQETIDRNLLESRLKEMDLMSEWKAFAALAVDYLGMPIEAMPLYDRSRRWARKGYLILRFVLDVGNFGHNRDASFYQKYPYVIYKAISLGRHIGDFFRHFAIFPLDSLRVFCGTLTGGVEAVAKGK